MITHDVNQLTTTITPEDAEDLLRRNGNNRNINRDRVTQYSKAMKAGEWQDNAQTIAVAKNGRLLDGQHRLASCVASGVPFRAIVVTGLTLSTMLTIDTGRSRTAPDILKIFGYTHQGPLAALARCVYRWERGDRRPQDYGKGNADTPSVLKTVDRLPVLQRYAAAGVSPIPGMQDSAYHFLRYLFFPVDPEWAEEFFRILQGGTVQDPEGHPVVALRTRLLSMSQQPKREGQRGQVIAYSVKAWNVWRNGGALKIMKLAPEERISDPA